MIKRIRNDEGSWVEGDTDLKKLIFSYYSELFKSQRNVSSPAFMNQVKRKVTPRMNGFLLAEFTTDEIQKALCSFLQKVLAHCG